MEWSGIETKIGPRGIVSRLFRRAYKILVGITLLVVVMPEERSAAQGPDTSLRLAVRPHDMATGTRTRQAGWQSLARPHGGAQLYVPRQCVGPRRCPLIVFLNDGEVLEPVAEKYGMIVLAINDRLALIDAALTTVLRDFAIDPDKIAIVGRCRTGGASLQFGAANMDVFSRIVPISPFYNVIPPPQVAPRLTTEFFFDVGLETSADYVFRSVLEMREAGHRVKFIIGFRGHEHQVEDYDFVGQWLQESWETSDPADRPAPAVVTEKMPVLTANGLGRMTAFWNRFMQKPDSIRTAARRAHLREVVLPIGTVRPSAIMTDMAVLAAKYPSIAVALQASSLTPEAHEAYRVALMSTRVMHDYYWRAELRATTPGAVKLHQRVGEPVVLVEPSSVLGQNIAFFAAHPNELEALEATGMWRTP